MRQATLHKVRRTLCFVIPEYLTGDNPPLKRRPKNAMQNPVTSTTFFGGTSRGIKRAQETHNHDSIKKLTQYELNVARELRSQKAAPAARRICSECSIPEVMLIAAKYALISYPHADSRKNSNRFSVMFLAAVRPTSTAVMTPVFKAYLESTEKQRHESRVSKLA
jgi:hypothetical protein